MSFETMRVRAVLSQNSDALGGVIFASLFIGLAIWWAGHNEVASAPTMASVTVKVSADSEHGSGVYLGNGVVLTVKHVADPKNGALTVTFSDGKKVKGIASFTSPDADYALVKISELVNEPVGVLACRDIKAGEPLQVAGYPVDWGFLISHVIADNPLPKVEGAPKWDTYIVEGALAPGQSGGPAFDKDGKVVGLADAILIEPGLLVPVTVPSGFGLIVPTSTFCNELPNVHSSDSQ